MAARNDTEMRVRQTRAWLRDVIIGHQFCPFAKREYDADRIHYAVIEVKSLEALIEQVLTHCAALDKDISRETTLLIFPLGLSDFEDYLDVLDLANAQLCEQGYEGVYQFASFHPEYRFEGAEDRDPANYTNRSPYPMIHILREASVEAAVKTHPNAEAIPQRNIDLARSLGLKLMKQQLDQCYDVDGKSRGGDA